MLEAFSASAKSTAAARSGPSAAGSVDASETMVTACDICRVPWRALKMLAVEKDTTLNALAVEAFNDLLKKHGKRQSVENPLLD